MNTGKFFSLRTKEKGTSLIEVMVSVAVLGVVAIGAVAIGDQTADQARLNRLGNNVFQIYSTIRSRTFLENDCQNFLRIPGGTATADFIFNPTEASEDGNSAVNAGQPIAIRLPGANGLGESIVSAGTNPLLEDLGLEITALNLTNSVFIPDGNAAAPQNYIAYVEIQLGRAAGVGGIGSVLGGSALMKKRVVTALYIETNAPDPNTAAPIASCRSASGDIDKEELCLSLGTKFEWDPVAETCTPPNEPMACPDGQVLTSVQGKTPVCSALGIEDQQCPPGQFIVQLGIGFLGCGSPGLEILTPTPGPPNVDCLAQSVIWSQSGYSCDANVPAILNGNTVSATDSTGLNIGTVDLTCNSGSLSQLNQICSPSGATNCTIPAGTTWDVAGVTCTSASAVNIADGSSATITDSVGPETGSVQYACNAGVPTASSPTCTTTPACGSGYSWKYDGRVSFSDCTLSSGASYSPLPLTFTGWADSSPPTVFDGACCTSAQNGIRSGDSNCVSSSFSPHQVYRCSADAAPSGSWTVITSTESCTDIFGPSCSNCGCPGFAVGRCVTTVVPGNSCSPISSTCHQYNGGFTNRFSVFECDP